MSLTPPNVYKLYVIGMQEYSEVLNGFVSNECVISVQMLVRYKKIVPNNTSSEWRFNNIQFVKDRFGNQMKDAFIFYGWNNSKKRQTSGFLYLDN